MDGSRPADRPPATAVVESEGALDLVAAPEMHGGRDQADQGVTSALRSRAAWLIAGRRAARQQQPHSRS